MLAGSSEVSHDPPRAAQQARARRPPAWSFGGRWRVVLAPAGAYVGQWLQSFREFPPRMKPDSFSLDRVMEAIAAPLVTANCIDPGLAPGFLFDEFGGVLFRCWPFATSGCGAEFSRCRGVS